METLWTNTGAPGLQLAFRRPVAGFEVALGGFGLDVAPKLSNLASALTLPLNLNQAVLPQLK